MSLNSSLIRGAACAAAAHCALHGIASGGGPNFVGCGQIERLAECGFALATDSAATILLADVGSFAVGDVVFAVGTLTKECSPGAPPACAGLACLTDASLAPCFQDCGVLVLGAECVLFQGQSGQYVLDNLGGFVVGDSVKVVGGLDLGCITFCQQGSGCVVNNLISTCELFSGCGVLELGPQSCTLFVPDDQPPGERQGYVLATYGDFSLGDRIYLEGAIDPDAVGCFPIPVPLIANSAVRPCSPPFEACGRLVAAPFCGLALAADQGGLWLLDDVGGFAEGDRVHVEGSIVERCLVVPECQIGACVDVSLVEPCGVGFFSGCGQVVESFACGLAFAADDGSGIYVLAEFGSADVGARIFVQGAVVADCGAGLGFCPCIENDAASTCIPVGDLDQNGIVDGADLGLLLGAWGTCPPAQIGCLGDLDFDGEIDGADLGVQLANWT